MIPLDTINNLIFDLGRVLINLDPERCKNNLRKLASESRKSLNEDHFAELFLSYEKGEISSTDFRNSLRQAFQAPALTDENIDKAWNSILLDIPAGKLDKLIELKKKYKLYLLSNTNELHREWVCKNSFPYKGRMPEDFFDKIFLSYKMGMIKPDANIFKVVLNETGIKSENTLFIDDLEANCKAASSLGIHAYHAGDGEWCHLFDE